MRTRLIIVLLGILNLAVGQSPIELCLVDDILFTVIDTPESDQLWRTDGECLFQIKKCDIASDCNFSRLVSFKNQLFFVVRDSRFGLGLWKSDGTSEGTELVKDFYNGPVTNNLNYFTVVNETLYFVANDGINGKELWKSNGTTSGTVMVKELVFNSTVDNPITRLTKYNDLLLFTLFDTNIWQTDLWKTDGSSEGTVKIKTFPGVAGGVSSIAVAGNLAFFQGYDSQNGFELWETDGTTTGTTLVKDIYPGATGSFPVELASVNSLIYFSANHPTYGRELWKSDGTSVGTTLVKDIVPGNGNGSPTNLTSWENALYFVSWNGFVPAPLWKTNGTDVGTVKLYDFVRDNASSIPYQFTVANNLLFFVGNDGFSGNELWKTNGTESGTELVIDTTPSGSGTVLRLTTFDNALYYTAYNGPDYSLWRTSGILAETYAINIEQNSNCQLISFPILSERTLGEQPFNLTASASSGLALSYSSNSNKIQIDGSQVTILESGPVTITAHQEGNGDFNSARNVSRSFCINPIAPVISKIQGSENALHSNYDNGNQWYLNGVPIVGEINSMLVIQSEGQYSAKVENEGCYSQFSNTIDVIVTSVDEVELDAKMNFIFPNPVKRSLFIQSPARNLRVYNSLGKQIHLPSSLENGVIELDCDMLNSGLYFIRFESNSVNQVFRFIKR